MTIPLGIFRAHLGVEEADLLCQGMSTHKGPMIHNMDIWKGKTVITTDLHIITTKTNPDPLTQGIFTGNRETIPGGGTKRGSRGGRRALNKKKKGITADGIFNLSAVEFTEAEKVVLDMGLKFVPLKALNKFNTFIDVQKY